MKNYFFSGQEHNPRSMALGGKKSHGIFVNQKLLPVCGPKEEEEEEGYGRAMGRNARKTMPRDRAIRQTELLDFS